MQSWLHVYVQQQLRGRKKTEPYGTASTTLRSRTRSIGYTGCMVHLNWRTELLIQWMCSIHEGMNVHTKSPQWEVWQGSQSSLAQFQWLWLHGNDTYRWQLTVTLNAILHTHFHFLFFSRKWMKDNSRALPSDSFNIFHYRIISENHTKKRKKKVWQHHVEMIKANFII